MNALGRGWAWFGGIPKKWVWRKAPFSLKDNDGPSHLWVIANMLAEKHGMEATAETIMRYAKQWASERTP